MVWTSTPRTHCGAGAPPASSEMCQRIHHSITGRYAEGIPDGCQGLSVAIPLGNAFNLCPPESGDRGVAADEKRRRSNISLQDAFSPAGTSASDRWPPRWEPASGPKVLLGLSLPKLDAGEQRNRQAMLMPLGQESPGKILYLEPLGRSPAQLGLKLLAGFRHDGA
jgi:hypothetical protein